MVMVSVSRDTDTQEKRFPTQEKRFPALDFAFPAREKRFPVQHFAFPHGKSDFLCGISLFHTGKAISPSPPMIAKQQIELDEALRNAASASVCPTTFALFALR